MAGEGHIGTDLSMLQIYSATHKSGLVMVFGEHAQVAASDLVATGLSSVLFAGTCGFNSSPDVDQLWTSVDPTTSGNITIKGWKPTAAGDVTPLAATTFGAITNWFAIGRL